MADTAPTADVAPRVEAEKDEAPSSSSKSKGTGDPAKKKKKSKKKDDESSSSSAVLSPSPSDAVAASADDGNSEVDGDESAPKAAPSASPPSSVPDDDPQATGKPVAAANDAPRAPSPATADADKPDKAPVDEAPSSSSAPPPPAAPPASAPADDGDDAAAVDAADETKTQQRQRPSPGNDGDDDDGDDRTKDPNGAPTSLEPAAAAASTDDPKGDDDHPQDEETPRRVVSFVGSKKPAPSDEADETHDEPADGGDADALGDEDADTHSRAFAGEATFRRDRAAAGDEDACDEPPPPPPPPLTEEELRREELLTAVRFLNAQVEHATPCPTNQRGKAQAAQDLALSVADLRHAQQNQHQRRSQQQQDGGGGVSPSTTTPSQSSPGGVHPVRRRADSSTAQPQQRLAYDWSSLHMQQSPSSAAFSPNRRSLEPVPSGSPGAGASSPAARRLPPLGTSNTSGSPLAPSASSPGLMTSSQARLRAARLAMSTETKAKNAGDEQQRYEVMLAHALEENSAVAMEHVQVSAQYASHIARKKELERENEEFRALQLQIRKELREAQVHVIDLERHTLSWHGKLRDLSLKLQRSRLKQTAEEAALSKQLRDATKQLSDARRVASDERDAFEAVMRSRMARAAALEEELRLFDPDKYIEKCEMDELRAEMQEMSLQIKRPVVAEVDTSSGRFQTFHYTAGGDDDSTAWATNQQEPAKAPAAAETTESADPSKPPSRSSAGSATRADEPSSVKLLRKVQKQPRHGKTKDGAVDESGVADKPSAKGGAQDTVHDADEMAAEILAQQEHHPTGGKPSTTKNSPQRGPPPPSKRLEAALSKYKAALSNERSHGGTAAQARESRLRKFLAGEF